MTGLAGLLLGVALSVGPDGYQVADQIRRSRLAGPLRALGAAARGVWIAWHRQPSWSRAFYSPPPADVTLAALLAGGGERLLPGLEVPRLFLHAPTFHSGSALVEIADMAVDVGEYYFHALIEAWLDRELELPDSTFRHLAAERAAVLLPEAAEPQRMAAYRSAVADFGSHVLSIAQEIERADRRAHAAGRDLCALLDPPQTLFLLWQRSIASAPYPGRYRIATDRIAADRVAPEGAMRPASGSLAAGGWVTTTRSLEVRDKELFLAHALGGEWSGDPERDFAHLCRRSQPGSES